MFENRYDSGGFDRPYVPPIVKTGNDNNNCCRRTSKSHVFNLSWTNPTTAVKDTDGDGFKHNYFDKHVDIPMFATTKRKI